MRQSNPAKAQHTLLLGITCLAMGVAGVCFAAWAVNDDIQKNGRLDVNAMIGVLIIGFAGLLFLLGGVAATYGGWEDRQRAIAIRAATAITPPLDTGSWQPPKGLTDHLGKPLGFDRDFFAPPPPEIGEVLSANTSLRLDSGSRFFVMNAARGLTAGLCAGAVVWLLMRQLEPDEPGAWWIGAALGACIVGMMYWGKERFRHVCCYVGRRGVARFMVAGERGRIIVAEMFLFRDAADVPASLVERLENGVYVGTDYRFDWLDADGRIVFQITGTYHRDFNGTNPWTDVPYQWGLAAQAAWRDQ